MNTNTLNTGDVTIDDLARMVAKGFKEVDQNFKSIRSEMATKVDLEALRLETKKDFASIRSEMAMMATRAELKSLRIDMQNGFNSIEENILKNHGLRLRRIETKLQMA